MGAVGNRTKSNISRAGFARPLGTAASRLQTGSARRQLCQNAPKMSPKIVSIRYFGTMARMFIGEGRKF